MRGALATLVLLCLAAGCGGECLPGQICGVAGTGALGFNGDGHSADQTDFYFVSAVREAPDGRVLVMDFNNHRLRSIGRGGRVETIAGNGLHLLATPGVPATESPLENPIDFAVLRDGRVAIAPLHDPRVLVIDRDGVLRVLAGSGALGDEGDGGPATAAAFLELTGLAEAPDGRLFIADGGANRVRVLLQDGTIAACAGTGVPGYGGDGGPATAARLNRPEGLAVDGAGDLYLAEVGNHIVRRVRASGVIETVAGTGRRGAGGDGGDARQAGLAAPEGVAVAADGMIYVADSLNARVRRIAPDGTVNTVAGNGEAGYGGDGGPATAAQLQGPSRLWLSADQLYIADLRNSRARVLRLR